MLVHQREIVVSSSYYEWTYHLAMSIRDSAVVVLAALSWCAVAEAQDFTTTAVSVEADTVSPDQYFIDKIFGKYGDNGVMTYEGFEHLLDNLGLGGGLFAAPHGLELHRINGTFKEIHDINHRHRRSTNIETVEPILKEKSCLSPQDILDVYGIEYQPSVISIKPETFLNLCPALIYQIDQKSCFQAELITKPYVEKHWAWIYASFSVLIISATGLLGVAIVPLLQSAMFNQVLHFLVAIAVGTLCGDAMLHLLPHALKSIEGDVEENEAIPVLKCSLTFLTVLLFYTMESLMHLIKGGHGHSHSQPDGKSSNVTFELGAMLPDSPPPPVDRPMTSTALMVILGDGLHNLTDGLAIGAAFSSDPVTGFATALAVFCHELPHELGDFAVLLRSGMSIKKALYYNVLSSALSFMGMVGGMFLAEDHASSSQWIYAATAGTFLYIALADLVPEINANSQGKILNFFLAFFGILLGGVIMLMIALYEDRLQALFPFSKGK